LLDRRTRLHELLLALIQKDADFELIGDHSEDLNSGFLEKSKEDFSKVIERNRKILNKYQSLVRSAVTLDALMDSENDENYKIKK
tara:strand:- start:3056 stop:3310 length:255 start_codon:yes stop_codon:yes gene_type:complete